MVGSGSAQAQTVARSFEELRVKLRPGATGYVTDTSGQERKAQILDLSPSSLALSMDGATRDLDENVVRRIKQRLPDPVWNGAVIGGAVGAAPLLVMCTGYDCNDLWSAPTWS